MWKIFGGSARHEPELSEAEVYANQLNQIETRLDRLELDSAERQVAVLNAIEKTMTQLRAREAKRARENVVEDTSSATIEDEDVLQYPSRRAAPAPTAHLAKRLRKF